MTIVTFLYRVNNLILNPLILLAFGVSFVYFIYGIIKFLTLDAADKSRKEAQDSIMWGIVGMVIMFSVYGIIKFVLATFGIAPAELGTDAGRFLNF
ncbi:MAG TPA: hypothetical protein VJC13_02500 [Candidatus Paceibacterota bacterium]